MDAVGVSAGVGAGLAQQGQGSGAAGLFQQFAAGGLHRIGLARVHAAGRKLGRDVAQRVAILPDQQDVIAGVQGHQLDPVGIFQNIVGCDHRAFVGDAVVGAKVDPAILVNDARSDDAPLSVRHRR